MPGPLFWGGMWFARWVLNTFGNSQGGGSSRRPDVIVAEGPVGDGQNFVWFAVLDKDFPAMCKHLPDNVLPLDRHMAWLERVARDYPAKHALCCQMARELDRVARAYPHCGIFVAELKG